MDEYQQYEGDQRYFKMMGTVIATRLKWFSRDKRQWAVLFMPLIYVIINLLITASFLSVMVTSQERRAAELVEEYGDEEDLPDDIKEELERAKAEAEWHEGFDLLQLFMVAYFALFLIQTILATPGVYNSYPMEDRKNGLRKMM